MLSNTELKTGVYIVLDGEPYQVTAYEHSKQARQGGVMRTTLRNLLTGGVVERSFKGSDKIEPADVSYQKCQYLYVEGDGCVFMNNDTYEQFTLTNEQLGDTVNYLIEGTDVDVQMFKGQAINVNLPPNLVFEVKETVPGVKGDTASGGSKPATIETGINVQVPLFVKEGDKIKVDTRNNNYIERVNS